MCAAVRLFPHRLSLDPFLTSTTALLSQQEEEEEELFFYTHTHPRILLTHTRTSATAAHLPDKNLGNRGNSLLLRRLRRRRRIMWRMIVSCTEIIRKQERILSYFCWKEEEVMSLDRLAPPVPHWLIVPIQLVLLSIFSDEHFIVERQEIEIEKTRINPSLSTSSCPSHAAGGSGGNPIDYSIVVAPFLPSLAQPANNFPFSSSKFSNPINKTWQAIILESVRHWLCIFLSSAFITQMQTGQKLSLHTHL